MSAGRWASGLAGLAGVVLVAAAVILLLAKEASNTERAVASAGDVIAVLALMFLGYGLAKTGPLWLRAVVVIGFTLLVASLWSLIEHAVYASVSTWHGDLINDAVTAAGLILIALGGLVVLSRGRVRTVGAHR